MIVYRADKKQFLADNDEHDIESVILARYQDATGRSVGEAELRSWRESLARMASVLRDDQIPAATGVAIEYHIPQSSKRIDVMLTGRNVDDSKHAVIVELKQWDHVQVTAKDAVVKTYVGHGVREQVHPSYQAWSYATLLEGFNEAVYTNNIALHPCCYLHNYERDGVVDSDHYRGYIEKAPIFLKGELERTRLREFIKRHIRTGDSGSVLFELENGRIKPSKALTDSLTGMLQGNPEFVLIDDQKTVFEAGFAAGQSASMQQRRVVIVQGGPGTGKTVLAINLLVALSAKGLLCKYVSRNAAPREVFQAKLTGSMTKTRYSSLFTGSGSFIDCSSGEFDCLIVDEAHRLNEKSGLYGNLGDHQVKEIIAASKCSVFFIDEDQQVTLRDVGSREVIRQLALEAGASVEEYTLASQFRCNGSDGYIAWLDNALQIRETANPILTAQEFDFRVVDSPQLLHAEIERLNAGNKARVVAGYCWPWSSKSDPTAFDIVIGDYRKRWNLDKDGSLWIISPDSISEVGCIHTCQGLELDYVGVIIGPDLVARDGRLVSDPAARARQDQTLKGYRRLFEESPEMAQQRADTIIKNTYRTLMTRGMNGCLIFSADEETRAYFASLLG